MLGWMTLKSNPLVYNFIFFPQASSLCQTTILLGIPVAHGKSHTAMYYLASASTLQNYSSYQIFQKMTTSAQPRSIYQSLLLAGSVLLNSKTAENKIIQDIMSFFSPHQIMVWKMHKIPSETGRREAQQLMSFNLQSPLLLM